MTTSNGLDKEASYDSIFFRDYLDVKDKYASYTGQNVAVATISRNKASDAAMIQIFRILKTVPFL